MLKKKCQVVMLPTNEKASKLVIQHGILLYYAYEHKSVSSDVNYELYFLSDEKIKEGDWCYIPFSNEVLKVGKGAYEVSLKTLEENKNAKKIIATTDNSLNSIDGTPYKANMGVIIHPFKSLPQPSSDFIKVFVEEYNKGNIIESVDVEYDSHPTMQRIGNEVYPGKDVEFIKINSNNEISIRKIKDSWNREEVESLLRKFNDDKEGIFDCTKWISENL